MAPLTSPHHQKLEDITAFVTLTAQWPLSGHGSRDNTRPRWPPALAMKISVHPQTETRTSRCSTHSQELVTQVTTLGWDKRLLHRHWARWGSSSGSEQLKQQAEPRCRLSPTTTALNCCLFAQETPGSEVPTSFMGGCTSSAQYRGWTPGNGTQALGAGRHC